MVKELLLNLTHGLRRAGGPLFLLVTLAYGLRDTVNTELVILLYVYALLGLAIYVPMILTDQVSLAYAAYAGIGGYSVAVLSASNVGAFWGVPIGVVLAGATAFLVALATSRLSSYFLAVGTLLVAIAFGRFLLQQADLTGGADGLTFTRQIFGIPVSTTALLIVGAVMIWIIVFALESLRRSEMGKGLHLMGGSRPAAESVGLNTVRFRILSLIFGAAIASLAGSLLAFSRGLVLPDSFHLELAFLILFIPLLGGKHTPWGCLVGSALLVYVLEVARSFGPGKLLYGLGVLACVLFFSGGIAERLGSALSALESKLQSKKIQTRDETPGVGVVPQPAEAERRETVSMNKVREAAASSPRPLIARGLSKTYGGVTALHDVSFELLQGEILGVVGPNGAGKTTLIDVLTGIQTGDSGEVVLQGNRLEGGASERALAGLSRTFQHPQLSGELTVGENIGLGLLRLHTSRSWIGMALQMMRSMFPTVKSGRDANDPITIEIGRKIGIEGLCEDMASTSFGTEKLTEIGRALISQPSVLLMDEPFAGLGKSEIDRVVDAVERWRQNALGVIIVDHNIDLLSGICDRLLVLDSGIVIACGRPSEVFSSPHVQKAYFGRE